MVGSDKLPPSQCIPEIAHFILRQHVEAPSMWAIFPLQVITSQLLIVQIMLDHYTLLAFGKSNPRLNKNVHKMSCQFMIRGSVNGTHASSNR